MLEPNLNRKRTPPYDGSLILDLSARSGTIKDAVGRQITNSGVVVSTDVTRNGNPSMYFKGAQYLSIPNTDNSLWLAGQFCFDFWFYLISRTAAFPTFFGNYDTWPSANGLQTFAGHSSSGTNRFSAAIAGGFPAINGTKTIVYGSWHHYALERAANGAITNYIDGAENGSVTTQLSLYGSKTKMYFGSPSDGPTGGGINGYIDRIRASNSSRYNGPFTPQDF